MSWWSALPSVILAIAVILLPGSIVALALGLRRLNLWAFAPAFSFSIIAIDSLANHIFDFAWGWVSLSIATLIVAAIAYGLRLTWRARSPEPRSPRPSRAAVVATITGLVVAVCALGLRLKLMFGSPDHVSQRFDNIFHLNAVRWIVENGNASPFKMATLTYDFDGQTGFYPNLWHGFVAIIAETAGVSVPMAINASNIALAAVAWPIASVLLVRQIVGCRPMALFAAGVLSSVFTAFPYLMLDFGVLYPTMLAITLLPIALAGVLMAVQVGAERRVGAFTRWFALVGVLPGLALAHPTILVTLLVITIPIGCTVAARQLRHLRSSNNSAIAYLPTAAVIAAWVLGLIVVFILVRPSTAALRFPVETFRQAAQGALINGTVFRPPDYVLSIFVILGMITCFRRRTGRWLVFAWVLSAGLYVVAASFPLGTLRTAITGFWYDDPYRVASVLPVLALPLAIIGIGGLTDALCSRLTRDHPDVPVATRRRLAAPAIVLVVLVGISSQSGLALAEQTRSGQEAYALTPDSPLLTIDELALLERLDAEVPENATVAGNPSTGTSLVYAIAGRRALLPHLFGERDTDTMTLVQSLRDADDEPDVCRAAEGLGVSYALEFGGADVDGIDRDRDFPGLQNLSTSDAVELVDREGDARLFRLTACDG